MTMLLALSLAACTDKTEDSAGTEAPSVSWLAPDDGATVTAGDVACSVVVEHFSLQDPAKHNEGEPIGHLVVRVDGTDTVTTGATQFSLTLAAGTHTLEAQLYYDDGDEVLAAAGVLCEEDDTSCAPVTASISVNVQ